MKREPIGRQDVLKGGRLVRLPVPNAWDRFHQWSLRRYDRVLREDVDLEPGVNFFVLVLERLGAEPMFSCEGHPHGFYVAFQCTERLALRISESLERVPFDLVDYSDWHEDRPCYGLYDRSFVDYDRPDPGFHHEDRIAGLRKLAARWGLVFGKQADPAEDEFGPKI